MSTVNVTFKVCDFCLTRASEHTAFRTFGYMSDGAGLFHDFCDEPSCIAEAQEIACNRPACQVFYPRSLENTR